MSPLTIQNEDALELMADLNETEVPIVPDDILFMIFKELSTEERAALGTSSKRFRGVDFELGRKSFEKISAKWNDIVHSVNGIAKNTNYSQQGRNSSLIPESIYDLRLFRKATTKLMKIKITSVGYPAKILWNFCDKFKTIPYTILRSSIACDYPILENFHKNLIKDRKIEQASMYLKLFSSFSYYNPDIASEVDRTRAFLILLPKVNNFKLVWTTKSTKPTIPRHLATVIDDPTLIHLVSNSNHTSLGRIHCTGHGLLSIFELVCRSPEYKYISCAVPTSAVEELFSMTNQRFSSGGSRSVPASRYLRDRVHRSILWEKTEGKVSMISIGKTDEATRVIHRKVSWQ